MSRRLREPYDLLLNAVLATRKSWKLALSNLNTRLAGAANRVKSWAKEGDREIPGGLMQEIQGYHLPLREKMNLAPSILASILGTQVAPASAILPQPSTCHVSSMLVAPAR